MYVFDITLNPLNKHFYYFNCTSNCVFFAVQFMSLHNGNL